MHETLSALTSDGPGPTDAADLPAPGPDHCAYSNGAHNTPDSYVHDAVQAALRELAHGHNRASPLAEIAAIVSPVHRLCRGTPEDTDTCLAAATPNGLPVQPGYRGGDQAAVASEVAVSMGQSAAPSEAITAALVSADDPGRSEGFIEGVPARIQRGAQHLLSVAAQTERMILLLQE